MIYINRMELHSTQVHNIGGVISSRQHYIKYCTICGHSIDDNGIKAKMYPRIKYILLIEFHPLLMNPLNVNPPPLTMIRPQFTGKIHLKEKTYQIS